MLVPRAIRAMGGFNAGYWTVGGARRGDRCVARSPSGRAPQDPESIAAKAAYVGAHQLGGLMFWELSVDDDVRRGSSTGGPRRSGATTARRRCQWAATHPAWSAIALNTGTNAKLGWKFAKGGTARAIGDFGDPLGSTTHTFCLYSQGTRIAEMKIPPGAGWQARSTGYRYAAPIGFTKLLLKAGEAGKPKAQVKGKGSSLPPIATPFAEPLELTAALVHDGGSACWAATYTSARTNVAGACAPARRERRRQLGAVVPSPWSCCAPPSFESVPRGDHRVLASAKVAERLQLLCRGRVQRR